MLDAASRSLARARQGVREARQRLVARLDAMLGALDPTDRAPDAAVTLRGGRYVILYLRRLNKMAVLLWQLSAQAVMKRCAARS